LAILDLSVIEKIYNLTATYKNMSLFTKDSIDIFVNHLVELEKLGFKLESFDSSRLRKEEEIQAKLLMDLKKLHGEHANKLLPLITKIFSEIQDTIENKLNDKYSLDIESNIESRIATLDVLCSAEEKDFLQNLVSIILEQQVSALNPYDKEEFLKIVKFFRTYEAKCVFSIHRNIGFPLKIDQLIAVHKTFAFPENGILKTTGQYNNLPRETIHFSLNGPQQDLGMYNININKYNVAILIPLVLIKDRIVELHENDSFVVGQLKLPQGSEIICKESEVVGHNPGNATIHTYPDSADINEVIEKRIRERGYSYIVQGQWGWFSFKHDQDKDKLRRDLHAMEDNRPNNDYNKLKDIVKSESYSGTAFKDDFDSMAKEIGVEESIRAQQAHRYTLFGKLEDLYSKYKNFVEDSEDILKCENFIKEADYYEKQLKTLREKYASKDAKSGIDRLIAILGKLKIDVINRKKLITKTEKAVSKIRKRKKQ